VIAGESLLFVDAEEGQELAQLRNFSPALYRGVGGVVARKVDAAGHEKEGAERTCAELGKVVEQLGIDCPFGGLHQPVGQPPEIIGGPLPDGVLARLRAVEIEALLEFGGGVWEPPNYHYRLPSGEHATGFVRTANAVGTPHDARVLASWLHQHARDGLGIVLDTGTTSAVALALQLAMTGAGMEAGAVRILAGYPTTERDVAVAMDEAGALNFVLVLLSVSSSGRLLHWLAHAASDKGVESAIEVLVNKKEGENELVVEGMPVSVWHPMRTRPPLIAPGNLADACDACRVGPKFLVPIRPDSFQGIFESSVTLMTPDLSDAGRNKIFWEDCDRLSAISLQAEGAEATKEQRAAGPMEVKINMAALVADETCCEHAASALQRQLVNREDKKRAHRGQREPIKPQDVALKADLVLVREEEADDLDDVARLLNGMTCITGAKELAPFPKSRTAAWEKELEEKVRTAETVLILSLGAVTGLGMQRALVKAQHLRHGRGGDPVAGLVLHSRLVDEAAWKTLRNSFNRHLHAVYASYLPLRSPLEEEKDVLERIENSVRGSLSKEAIAFMETRQLFCDKPERAPNTGLFWGSRATDQLTPLSVLGENLRPIATYVAVASFLEGERQQEPGPKTPEMRVFDLASIARSYYDPMILSAILRWIDPREAWWGRQLRDAVPIMFQILARGAEQDDLRILVPELLFAGAQGKLSRLGLQVVAAWAQILLDGGRLPAEDLPPVELGLALIPDYEEAREEGLRRRVEAALDK